METTANPYLEWVEENAELQRLEVIDKVFIGRTCRGVAEQKRILLRSPLVSRNHAEITKTAARLRITDTSKNGIWVNGIRVASGSSKDLADGDTIRIGEFDFQVVYPDDAWAEDTYEWPTELTIVSPSELVVTNLVADVRGFSAFSQDHASSEVYALIKEIFGRFTAVVNDFDGTIKDYAGDAVFAFWDHQIEASASQAVLACQAAVQQMQALDQIVAELSGKYPGVANLQMGWGITTGQVMMSHYGSRVADMAMIGDCINLAFRLSGIANRERPEEILICDQTADLVRNDFAVKDVGMVSIRGRKGMEHVFALNEPE